MKMVHLFGMSCKMNSTGKEPQMGQNVIVLVFT